MKQLLILIFICLISGCGTWANDRLKQPLHIKGIAISLRTNSPVENYNVELLRLFPGFIMGSYITLAKTKTDKNGEFDFEINLNGSYDIGVYPPPNTESGNGGSCGVFNISNDVYMKIPINDDPRFKNTIDPKKLSCTIE